MSKNIMAVVLLLFFAAPPAGFASDARFYFGFDVQSSSTNFNKAEIDVNPGTVIIDANFDDPDDVNGVAMKLGWNLGNFFALEGQLSGSKTFKETQNDGSRVRFGANAIGSLFLRINIPFKKVTLYGLLGYSGMQWNGSCTGPCPDSGGVQYDLNELSYGPAGGLGIEFYGTERTALNLSFVRYVADFAAASDGGIGITHDAINFGFIHHFGAPRIYRRF